MRPAHRVLLVAGAMLAAVWALAPAPSPPLYDGLLVPAEAYRYLHPPAGAAQTQPPTSAQKAIPVQNGDVQAGLLATGEQPPQAQFLLGDGALAAPPGATSVALSIRPVDPPQPLPASLGRLDGNVYQIEATVGGSPVAIKSGHPCTVVLRGPANSSGAQVVRLTAGGTWEKIRTIPMSGAQDTVAANTDQFGWFAMALSGASTGGGGGNGGSNGNGGGGGGGFPVVAVVIPAVVALLGVLLLLVRLSRTRAQQPPRGPAGRPPRSR